MHHRNRHIEQILLKRAKIFPVLGVLGPRQVGKSTFLMQQWCQQTNATYITLDEKEISQRAQHAPAQLLLDESADQTIPLIIDEAQKVPHIFDSIKAIVDRERRNGAFTMSGSVDFSAKSGVRESLAGRMGVTKLYPMTLREINNKNFVAPWVIFKFAEQVLLQPKSVETWLERGGMPIFCSLSDVDERVSLINSWVDAICYKDIKQLKDYNYDSAIAYNLLLHIVSDSLVSHTKLAAEYGTTDVSIKKHLDALEALFIIYKIPAFANPRARVMYKLFDAGVFNALRGGVTTMFSRRESLIILLLNEIYAQYEYSGKLKPNIYYYKTKGGAAIDLVLKTRDKLVGIECLTSDDILPYRQRGMRSFLANNDHAIGFFVAPVQRSFVIDKKIHVIPWNSIG